MDFHEIYAIKSCDKVGIGKHQITTYGEPVARKSPAPKQDGNKRIVKSCPLNTETQVNTIRFKKKTVIQINIPKVDMPQVEWKKNTLQTESLLQNETKALTNHAPSRINIIWNEPNNLITKSEPVSIKLKNFEKHRDNIREVLKCSNATPIKSGGLSYTCCFCPEQCTNPHDLKQHTLDTHGENERCILMMSTQVHNFLVKLDITNLKCKLCDCCFDTLEDLYAHLKNDHQRRIHLDIDNRIIPYKFLDDNLKCAICRNEYYSFKKLQEHMNLHYSNYICDFCAAGFITPSLLASHARAHKEAISDSKFKCPLCSKAFTSALRLKTHNKAVHSKLTTVCSYCNESFDSYKTRFKHLAEVHGVRIADRKCNACDKSFPNSSQLSNHIKRKHTVMERSHACSHCDYRSHSKQKVVDHMISHTGVKKFECYHCHKNYGRKKSLREHMRIHMNDRRFECAFCGLKFVQNCSLKGHMRSKHGEHLE